MNDGIIVDSVSFHYGDVHILHDISFSVGSGKIAALVGPNGTGKTTLLRIMTGILAQQSGSVFYDGQFISEQRKNQTMVGFVPQGHRTAFPFSCFDVVLTGRHPFVPVYRTPSREDEQIVDKTLDEVGASFLRDRPFTRISGGERQLVLIARALAMEPRFLILDEPTTFLDMRNQVQILSLIRNLSQKRGITTIMSIHDPSAAAQYADQAVILGKPKDGPARLIANGKPQDVFTKEILMAAFDIPVQVFHHDGIMAVIPVGTS